MPLASTTDVASSELSRRGRFVFDEFELDLDRGNLTRCGEEIPLRPKSYAVLEHLLEHAGQLVTRQELMAAVWPDVVVTDDSIAQCLIEIRRALGDDERSMIRTVPRRGVILDVAVRFEDDFVSDIEERRSGMVRHGRTVVATLLVAASLLLWWAETHNPDVRPENVTAPPPVEHSIAVLRFSDLSQEGDATYLADGFSEEIMHSLAQTPSLRLIARTSSFALDGQPVSVIAKSLGVTHVLEGSVRKQGDDIRVTAQFIDAQSSSHIWSRTYDRNLSDILDVQRDIANAVATALEVTLAGANAVPAVDPRAYELFLEGRYFYLRRADGDQDRALERYEAALAISPEFASAWTGLSAVTGNLLFEARHSNSDPTKHERLREINRHATEQALRYGPNLPETHMRVARYYYLNGDRARAREHVEIARSIDPDHWLVRFALVHELQNLGRIDESIALVERELQRDPLNMLLRENLTGFLIWAQRYQEARTELEKIAEFSPAMLDQSSLLRIHRARTQILLGDYESAAVSANALANDNDRLQLLAMAYHGLGRASDSDAMLSRLIEVPSDDWKALFIAETHAKRGESQLALEWLNQIDLGMDCQKQGLVLFVYYSPFLIDLNDMPQGADYRADVLESVKACRLGLKIPTQLLTSNALVDN